MKKNKRTNNSLILVSMLLIISLLFISIGFSALSTTLTLNGTAFFEPVGLIRVMSIKTNKLNQVTEISKTYYSDTINVLIDFDDVKGTATYDVKISNLGEIDKELVSIREEIFTTPEIEYEITGLEIGDIIKKKESIDFKITFKYKSDIKIPIDTNLNARIKFIFEDYQDRRIAYFKPYDGTIDLMGFDKTNIVSFSRNRELTEEEVLAKPGVELINNDNNDNYKSDYNIYGYVENNNFYWWSEAPIVYFHPNTTKAFSKFTNLITVDLNGISTINVENFAHFFDSSRKLKNIIGTINTSGLKLEYNDNFNYRNDKNNDSSSGKGLTYMFNDCNSLESIDLSEFYTTNASDMKRMFAGCKKLKKLDLSTFDTSNVKSMYWMFRTNESMTELDLSGFDTKNVQNMFGMFVQDGNLKTIKLGDNFDTSKVKYMENMFYGNRNLTTIYAKSDFVRGNDVESNNMFYNNNKLVGAAGTDYAKAFDSKYKDKTYAQLATPDQEGYFTLYEGTFKYTITYDLDGGVANNPTNYDSKTETFTLNNPKKTGYKFIGWTGSNGEIPQLTVEIKTGTIGNKNYKANYEINKYRVIFNSNTGTGTMEDQIYSYDEFKKLTKNTFNKEGYVFNGWNTNADGTGIDIQDEKEVGNLTLEDSITLYAKWKESGSLIKNTFNLPGPCNFNGENENIGGANCSLYSNTNYINTGIYLFDTNNINEDFDISFNIDEYSPNQTTIQATLLNSMTEIYSKNNPGFVLRKENDNFSLKIQDRNSTENVKVKASTISKIRIIRKNNKVCYSMNDSDLKYAFDFSNLTETFNIPITFGAALDKDGAPWRFTKMTLSNINIRVGKLEDIECNK